MRILKWLMGEPQKPDFIYFKSGRACFDVAAYLASDEGYERLRRFAIEPTCGVSMTPYQKIIRAAKLGTGLHLTAEEVSCLSLNSTIDAIAADDDDLERSTVETSPALPYHLQDESPPLGQCNKCGRKTWNLSARGKLCDMPQPDGTYCDGTL
jgi:hypothetical protein